MERGGNEVFDAWVEGQVDHYEPQIRIEAAASREFRRKALYTGVISLAEALEMPGGPSAIEDYLRWLVYDSIVERLNEDGVPVKDTNGQLASIGRYIVSHPARPWIRSRSHKMRALAMTGLASVLDNLQSLDEFSGLGLAAAIAMQNE